MLQNCQHFPKFFTVFLLIFAILIQVYCSHSSPGKNIIQIQEQTNFETTQLNISKYEEEYKTFQSETDLQQEQSKPKSRKKRYIYLNVQSNLDVGFLCVIPITIILPSMSNLFNKWRRKRSLQLADDQNSAEFEDSVEIEPIEEHPLVQPHLNKISTYFELLDIPEHHCQLRAICEFSSDPSTYYPVSEMIIGRLRAPSMYSSIIYDAKMASNSSREGLSLYEKYSNAADDGVALGHPGCQERYGPGCKYSMEQLLSMNFLRVWKGLKSQFGVGVKEDFAL